jgi:hypothetical protein
VAEELVEARIEAKEEKIVDQLLKPTDVYSNSKDSSQKLTTTPTKERSPSPTR